MGTALVVVDMQHFFLDMARPALTNIERLIQLFAALGLPRIFTQHGHSQAELTPPFSSQLVRKWGPAGSIRTGSEEWKLIPAIASLAQSCPVISKNTYDAFLDTNLASLMREHGVNRVVICGVMTDVCCDTTARSAFNRGFETWLVEDACASANKEQHDAGIKGFEFAFGDVVSTENVLSHLQREKAGGESESS